MTFTEKEREVLELLAQGRNIKEAAHALDIHYSTATERIRYLKERTGESSLVRLLVLSGCLRYPAPRDDEVRQALAVISRRLGL